MARFLVLLALLLSSPALALTISDPGQGSVVVTGTGLYALRLSVPEPAQPPLLGLALSILALAAQRNTWGRS